MSNFADEFSDDNEVVSLNKVKSKEDVPIEQPGLLVKSFKIVQFYILPFV